MGNALRVEAAEAVFEFGKFFRKNDKTPLAQMQRSVKMFVVTLIETLVGVVAQLVRVPDCRSGGCGFESRRRRLKAARLKSFAAFLFLDVGSGSRDS